MIPELFWIIGFYAAAAAMAHWMFRRGASSERRHYVLVAGNHQMQIEWYVRALQQFSRRTGTDIGITVVLEESSDETGAILERFARGHSGVGWVHGRGDRNGTDFDRWERSSGGGRGGEARKVVWVDLAREDDVARLPL